MATQKRNEMWTWKIFFVTFFLQSRKKRNLKDYENGNTIFKYSMENTFLEMPNNYVAFSNMCIFTVP
jgi:hypothetical protein